MKKDSITHTYAGIEITYDEETNRWRFECRGRERSSESLTLAKAAIDKPDPSEKPPFKRCTAIYKMSYGGEFKVVDITSTAERPKYGSDQCNYYWAIDPTPKHRAGRSRERVSGGSLLANTPANHERLDKIARLLKEEETLQTRRKEIVNQMDKFKPE